MPHHRFTLCLAKTVEADKKIGNPSRACALSSIFISYISTALLPAGTAWRINGRPTTSTDSRAGTACKIALDEGSVCTIPILPCPPVRPVKSFRYGLSCGLHPTGKNEMLAPTERHKHMRRKGSYPQNRARLNASQKCDVSGQKWLRIVAGCWHGLIIGAPELPLEHQKAPARGKGFSSKILFLLW